MIKWIKCLLLEVRREIIGWLLHVDMQVLKDIEWGKELGDQ